MEVKIIETRDGSHSIAIPQMDVTYHSTHGAIAESQHVFIERALRPWLETNDRSSSARSLHIFEAGFGTGLNALLTLIEAERFDLSIIYEAAELHPVPLDIADTLNYCEQLGRNDLWPIFHSLHDATWGMETTISDNFKLRKRQVTIDGIILSQPADLIYFDAFAPGVQPELWNEHIFANLFGQMTRPGLLATYCSKSVVRKSMKAAGFDVKKVPGPHGKREMVNAWKR